MEKRIMAVWIARALFGVPYVYGGNDIDGIDCSGLVRFVLRIVGLIPPKVDMTAQDFYSVYKEQSVPRPYCGCLLFFGESLGDITHIAIAEDNQNCISAASKYVTKAEVQTTRIRYRDDLLAIVDPFNL